MRAQAPLFTSAWLLDALPKALGLSRPTVTNSDGDEVVFHEIRFRIAPQATPQDVAERLTALASLERADEAFWNWLGEPAPFSPARGGNVADALSWKVSMEDGRTVLGNIECKGRSLIVGVNSAARAERAIAMLRAALGGLVGTPLTQVQTIEQILAERRERPRPERVVSPEVDSRIVHDLLDRQYRTVLDQPVPMLGGRTPRAAVRTRSGREKVAVWLKHLENQAGRTADASDSIATYDFAWLWRELKVEDLRR